jgi:DNA-directed RNA polymerase II subunit RPB7
MQVEGSCDGDYGYVVAVLQIIKKGKGRLKDTTGFASYDVTYSCLVLRPFRGEVMDTLVTSVSKVAPPPPTPHTYTPLPPAALLN